MFLSVPHIAVMFFCHCLNYEKEAHKQLDTAGIWENRGHHLDTQLTVLSFFVGGESMNFLSWRMSLPPLWNATPRFHNQWQCSVVQEYPTYWFIQSQMLQAQTHNLFVAFTHCLEHQVWPPSYNQKCHEQFHAFLLAKCWAVLQSEVFSHICLKHKAFHMTCSQWMLMLLAFPFAVH